MAGLTPKSRQIDDLPSLVQDAIDNPNENNFTDTREVTRPEAKRILDLIGHRVLGYVHVIDGTSVRHILKDHSQDALPMTPDDILRIPEITRDADTIEQGEEIRGLERLIYRKRENGQTIVIEEVRTRRAKLALVTAYKVPMDEAGATPVAPAVPGEALAHTSETTGVNVSNK